MLKAALLTALLFLSGCEEPIVITDPDYTGFTGTVTDIEGNTYKTIGIGSQIWMASNLRVTKLNDGTSISLIQKDSIWKSNRKPSFCWYGNDSAAYSKSYGALYNFYVIETGGICPEGWHVASLGEWKRLSNYLGGYEKAGGKLKDYNSNYWTGINNCLANNYGFAALPGGSRKHFSGRFSELGAKGYWWTSTQVSNYMALSTSMSSESTNLNYYEIVKIDGHSVRCLKDP